MDVEVEWMCSVNGGWDNDYLLLDGGQRSPKGGRQEGEGQ